jgi:hypothetical protein
MRAAAVIALLALAAAGCSDSPCQELGERICRCQPGATNDGCQSQVESQLDAVDAPEGRCDELLGTCVAPEGGDLCEWLLTAAGKDACGLTPTSAAP